MVSSTVPARALPCENLEVGAFIALLLQGSKPQLKRIEAAGQVVKQSINGRLVLCATYKHTHDFSNIFIDTQFTYHKSVCGGLNKLYFYTWFQASGVFGGFQWRKYITWGWALSSLSHT